MPNRYVVSIAKDCPVGIHEAYVMTRLGVSSARVFNVSSMNEVTRTAANTSLKTAMPLKVNSICNAVMTSRAVDYYSFEAKKDQRIVVDCAAPRDRLETEARRDRRRRKRSGSEGRAAVAERSTSPLPKTASTSSSCTT